MLISLLFSVGDHEIDVEALIQSNKVEKSPLVRNLELLLLIMFPRKCRSLKFQKKNFT